MKISRDIGLAVLALLLAGCSSRSAVPCVGQAALGKPIPMARYLDASQQERINRRLGEYLALVATDRNQDASRYLSYLDRQSLGDPPDYGMISRLRLCSFTPDRLEQVQFDLNEDKRPGEPDYSFELTGVADCREGGKPKKVRAVIQVSFENGDWYFSPLLYEGQFPDREILK